MTVDYIIAGQGICGTWLSYYLLKENKSLIVFDKKDMQGASNVASGLINPVTGRRVVTTWMAEELLPFVWNEYNALGYSLRSTFINQKNILAFPAATDLQQAFNDRMKQQNSFIKQPLLKKEVLHTVFNFPFDVFEISPCYVVQMRDLLQAYRAYLKAQHILIEEIFDESLLEIKGDFIQYKNTQARKVIYAGGIQSAQSKYWLKLPFVPNKGQALIIEIDGIDASYVYKFGHLTLIPLHKNIWWVGSSNELGFETTAPTEDFYKSTSSSLKSILKKKFIVKEHWASLRPATVERRPFVGIHPAYEQVAILNGMGSKACSLAPWFAKQLTDNIIYNKPIDPLADVGRFSKMLGNV